ncbi:DUF4439 domain-containing protein [Oceanitalea stevensii]|uniref:DUF4439 domain-containing protein n=1 Tax=Oceanitalea stevensii TaxID=2763072 RepID=A0ABR8YXU0_9MICO|nr:DUF4439 domain-containing protein [Oceanitalea stevensii]MBD8060789.1 DUF4439 domain-containing protein [Oceanitalea stevensii]
MCGRRALGAALLAALTLTGCGVRLETPPPEVPTADAGEESRQDAALVAAQLRDAAGAAATDDGADVGEVLTAVEEASAEHHEALGGVWEPWPGAGPDATAYPEDPTAPAPAAAATPQEVLELLEEGAATAREDALAHDGELGQLLAAVAISRTWLAADLARALSVDAERLPAEPQPAPEPGTVDTETSRAVDAARYAFEVVAARSSGGQREAAAVRAEQLALVAGAVAPEEDEREVAYDVSDAADAEAPERALAGAAELDVLGAYVALLGTPVEDRETVLDAATYAAGQARSWDTALPALPGLS